MEGISTAEELLGGVLDAVENASPLGAVEAATATLAQRLQASAAFFLIADIAGGALVRMSYGSSDATLARQGLGGDEGRLRVQDGEQSVAVPITAGGSVEAALRTQTVQLLPASRFGTGQQRDGWVVLAPVTERGEVLGLLQLTLPVAPDAPDLAQIRRIAHLLAFGRDPDGTLLGAVELQEMQARGEQPAFVGSGPNFEPNSAQEWLAYFRYCSAGGATWREGSFVPVMEGRAVVEARPLLANAASAYPDLAEISTSIGDHDRVPAVLFGTEHPFAVGYCLTDATGDSRTVALDEPVPLTGHPGEHTWQVATRTPYGTLRPSQFRFTIR